GRLGGGAARRARRARACRRRGHLLGGNPYGALSRPHWAARRPARMSSPALVLTYHAIEAGPPPLCIEPAALEEHLEVIGESGVEPVSLTELAGRRRQAAGEPCVALTFDDGFASVADAAAPMLAARGIPATIFCVAGHLGGRNDFATDPPSTPKRRLATDEQLAGLDGNGLEVGSH